MSCGLCSPYGYGAGHPASGDHPWVQAGAADLDAPRKEPVTPKLTGPYRDETLLTAVDAEIAAFRAKGASMAELRPGYLNWAAKTGLERLLPSLSERRKVIPQLERRFRRATHDSLADYARLRAAGQIVEEHGEITWVFAETEGKTRIRLKRAGMERTKKSRPQS